MNNASPPLHRRQFLASLSAAPLLFSAWSAAEPRRPLKIAAVLTTFFYRSHADVILENVLVPYLFNGKVIDPREDFQIASFYVDQFPANRDMARATARQFNIPIYESITKAICLGGDQLAVDAVLLIGEHGQYPFNPKGQELYPKKPFFDEITSVFKKSGRVVPVYNDKHLSHSWTEAKEMVGTARAMSFGLMAGSSVPLAQRIPPVKLPGDAKIPEAVSIHGGPLERYGFHGLEVLQSMIDSHAIQSHFRNNRPPYPVERTLLVSGALEAAIDSHVDAGSIIKTPHLEFAYTARDFTAYREMGATWKIITDDTPQPKGIEPVGIDAASRK